MRKSVEALVIVPMLLIIAAMLALGLCGIARAEPVQQFTFQVESPRAGDLSAHMHLRRYDTTGLVPPTPTDFSMRLPRGVEVNPAFLTSRYLCDGPALRDTLDAHISAAGVPFPRRLERLGAFAREAGAQRHEARPESAAERASRARGDVSAAVAGSSTRATPCRS